MTSKYLDAVAQDGMALMYVPEALRTKALCATAVAQDGMALFYVPAALITEALCATAVAQEGRALRYVPKYLHAHFGITALAEADGYTLYEWRGRYYAGCRDFTCAEALAHWAREDARARAFTAAIINQKEQNAMTMPKSPRGSVELDDAGHLVLQQPWLEPVERDDDIDWREVGKGAAVVLLFVAGIVVAVLIWVALP